MHALNAPVRLRSLTWSNSARNSSGAKAAPPKYRARTLSPARLRRRQTTGSCGLSTLSLFTLMVPLFSLASIWFRSLVLYPRSSVSA
jgi:hypothetical protein